MGRKKDFRTPEICLFHKYDHALDGLEGKSCCTTPFSLLQLLQSLITPYLAPLIDPTMELLGNWSDQGNVDHELWAHMIQFLTLSFEVDEGGEPGKTIFKGTWKLTIDRILEG